MKLWRLFLNGPLVEGQKKYNYDACYWTPELKQQLADLHSEWRHLSVISSDARRASANNRLEPKLPDEKDKRLAKMDFENFDDFVAKTEFEINQTMQKFSESLKTQNIKIGDKVTITLHDVGQEVEQKYRLGTIDEYNGLLTVRSTGIGRIKKNKIRPRLSPDRYTGYQRNKKIICQKE